MSFEANEAYDNLHDPQRATPVDHCRICGTEIYSDEELYVYDGLCPICYRLEHMNEDEEK